MAMVAAITQVALERKSAVRRVPNMLPTLPPPKVAVKPLPLDCCVKTTSIRKIANRMITILKKVNIFSPKKYGSGGGTRTPDTWIMIPLL